MKINTWRLFGIIGLIFMAVTVVTFAASAARGTEPQEELTTEEPAPTQAVEPSPEPSIEPTPEPTIEPTPTPAPTPEPTPSPTLTPDEVLQETWFSRRTPEEMALWAATQEAHDRAWFAANPADAEFAHPCWPPEAMPWYPNDFPPPASWSGMVSGCR